MGHFNTSHVNVNLRLTSIQSRQENDFNTSHVNVNHCRSTLSYIQIHISIHLMLMLIQLAACWKDNSSLISIHLMLMLIEMRKYKEQEQEIFQYISC